MAFKIPKNTLICFGILIAVLVGLYFAQLYNNDKLPSFLKYNTTDTFENESESESENEDDDEEEDDDEDWKTITEADLLEMA